MDHKHSGRIYRFLMCLLSVFLFYSFSVARAGSIPGAFSFRASGARPLGVGEAFGAVADDINTLWYNPAGLGALRKNYLGSSYANLYDVSKLWHGSLGLVKPIRGVGSFGIGWTQLSAGDVMETDEDGTVLNRGSQSENILMVAFGRSFMPDDLLSAGVNVRYLNMGPLVKEQGWTLDSGILLKPNRSFSFGLSTQNLIGGPEGEDEDSSEFNPQFSLAAAWRRGNYMLASEISQLTSDYRRFRIGTEIWFLNRTLALRTGFQKRFAEGEPLRYSLGSGFRITDHVQIDYAYLMHPKLGDTHYVSANLSFWSFSPGRAGLPVRFVDIEVRDIFPSHLTYYLRNPLANVSLEELSGNLFRDAKVSLYIPGYMDSPSEQVLDIEAKGKITIPLTAVLKPSAVYETDENIPLNATIRLEYYDGEERQEDVRSYPVILYNRNTLDWRFPESFAAFITQNDSVVSEFVSEVLNSIDWFHEKISPKLVQAMAVYSAIASMSIQYFEDARINRISPEDTTPLDKIQYPRESLKRRMGDCDDWTSAYAACLETIGISTAFILVPRHIFLMFDTGIPIGASDEVTLDETLIAKGENGYIWIPIEVTMLESGDFLQAWQKGAEQYRQMSMLGDLQVIYTSQAQKSFPPLPLPATPPVSTPNIESIQPILSNNIRAFVSLQQRGLEELKRETGLANAVRLAMIGEYETAERRLQELISRGNEGIEALTSLGNVYAIQGDFDRALEQYDAVLQKEPQNVHAAINRGLTYLGLSRLEHEPSQVDMDLDLAVESFELALSSVIGQPFFDSVQLEKAYDQVLRLLGFSDETGLREKKRQISKLSPEEIQRILAKAKQKLAQTKKVTLKPKPHKKVIGRRGDPALGLELKHLLLWRDK